MNTFFNILGLSKVNADDLDELTERLIVKKIINWWQCPPYTKLNAVRILDDGNCLLHAVSLALYGSQDTELNLRRLLHIYLSSNEYSSRLFEIYKHTQTISNAQNQFEMSKHEFQNEWNAIVEAAAPVKFAGKYKWLEAIHIFALANCLKIPIIVLAQTWQNDVSGNKIDRIPFGGIYLPLMSEPIECEHSPIFLAYDLAHFSMLESKMGYLTIPINNLEVQFSSILSGDNQNENLIDKYVTMMSTQYRPAAEYDNRKGELSTFGEEEVCLSHNDFSGKIVIKSDEIVNMEMKNLSTQCMSAAEYESRGNEHSKLPILCEEEVYLNHNDCDLNIDIESDRYSAKSISSGILAFAWGGVRASHGVVSSRVFFEVKITDAFMIPNLSAIKQLYQIRVGWSKSSSSLQLGDNDSSFAFCSCGYKVYNNVFEKFGMPCVVGDVIGIYLDMCNSRCSVNFSINGIDQGTAFQFEHPAQALYPHILSKNVKYEVNFGRDRFLSPEKYMSEYQLIGHCDCIEWPDSKKSSKVILLVGILKDEKREWAMEYIQSKMEKIHILDQRALIEKMKVKIN